jgi:DNA primase
MSKLISERTKENILESVTTETYAQITGQQPRRSGANYFIKSPFSDEKNGSFCIWSDMRFKDFSSGKAGDIISLAMDLQGMEYPDAIKQLADMHNITVEYDGPEIAPEVREKRDEMQRCLDAAMNLYIQKRAELLEDHPCHEHLREVRELDPDTINAFEIGYAPGDGQWLAKKLLEQGLIVPAIELGLVINSEGQQKKDRMRDAIVFPIRSKSGKMAGFACRPFSGKPAKYLNAPSNDLYDKSRTLYGLNLAKKSIARKKQIYITEGYFDVISLHRAGAENAVATCGTALTEEHAFMIKKMAEEVIILRDGDEPGKKAARRDFELLLRHGLIVKLCNLPNGADPDDFVREHMKPRTHFTQLQTI